MQVHIDIPAWPAEEGYVMISSSAALGPTRYINLNSALQENAYKKNAGKDLAMTHFVCPKQGLSL